MSAAARSNNTRSVLPSLRLYLAEFHCLGFGGELVVEHSVVDRIEEILQVIEHHLVGLLREARHNECRQQQGEYQSFFIILKF